MQVLVPEKKRSTSTKQIEHMTWKGMKKRAEGSREIVGNEVKTPPAASKRAARRYA